MKPESMGMRAFAISLAVVLMVGLLTGCGQNTSTQSEGTAQGTDTKKVEEIKPKERMKISMMGPLYGEPAKPGNIALKTLEDKLNVQLELMEVPGNNYTEKMNVAIASKNMPDTFVWTSFPDPDLNKYVEQGAFQPLDEHIKKYPNIMKTPSKIWDTIKIKGKIYGIPRTRALTRAAVIIRKDWLDNLGLPIPETTEEFLKTAVKFTTDDPDKNGKPDTFGVVAGENVSHQDSWYIAFDAGNGWKVMSDGTLMNADITPGRKEALGHLAELYKQGALDKDFPVLKNTQVWEKLESGKGGIFWGAQTSDFARYVENLAKVDPKGQLIMIDPPVGPRGTKGFHETTGFFGQLVIPADRKPDKVARIMEVLDYQGSDEGYQLGRYGIVGVHSQKDPSGGLIALPKYKEDGVGGYIYNAYDPYQYASSIDPKVKQMQKENLDRVTNMGVSNPAVAFIAPTAISKQADLNKLRDEYFVKIVSGKLPIDAFDQFVNEWMAKGGKEITDETNKWYKENSGK